MRAPQHRADCGDFYHEPTDTESIGFRAPDDILAALEDAAERAGRTWNAQLQYVLRVCRLDIRLSVDDWRTVREWQALMTQTEMCFNEGEDWIPCHVLFRNCDAIGQA